MTILNGEQGARVMSEAFKDPTRLIDSFTGKHSFLSNFERRPFTYAGAPCPTAEHGFNADKTLDPDQRAHVMAAPTPGEAKRRGRAVTLRPGWDDRVRYEVMTAVLAAKFTDPDLREQLLGTGDALLIESTTWHDQVWGDCGCDKHRAWPGKNRLGLELMALRGALRGDPPDRWTRVAVTGHRPQFLTPNQQTWAQGELDRLAVKLRDRHGTKVAITGAALGSDTWWARSAVRADLDVWAYIPFLDQAAKWADEDKVTWRALLGVATRTLILGAGYNVGLLHSRNDFMLRDADLVIAVWDPTKTTGGTASAVSKARAAGKTLVVVDVTSRTTRIERR